MLMNNNMLQLIKMLQSSGNPQQIIMNMVGNNPTYSGIIDMINSNNTCGLEMIARNIAKEKGVDIDSLINQMKNIR